MHSTAKIQRTIFLVEDDRDIARLVEHHLVANEFTVRTFSTASSLLEIAQRTPPALFILDILLPGGNGLDLCMAIRKSAVLQALPLLFLTAKSEEADRVLGLELGADDYITKPFSPRELVARVKAVLRRYERLSRHDAIEIGQLKIDPGSMVITLGNKSIQTTGTEFRLLEYLARHPKRVFTRDQLLDAVWGDTRFVTPRSVDVYIRRIREKLEQDPERPVYLHTVRGTGYRFEVPR